MKYYELSYLIKPDLSEEEAQKTHQEIISSIQTKEGLLDASLDPKKIRLSYPIKKAEEAYLATIIFYLKKESINSFQKELKENKDILRFLVFVRKKPKATTEPSKQEVKIKPEETIKMEKPKKAELKDIDKKLEEILKK